MTFRGFLFRLAYVVLFTWIVGSLIESIWWGLYFVLLPIFFYEMMRPRWPQDDHESDHDQNT